jgi:hypothetical protein
MTVSFMLGLDIGVAVGGEAGKFVGAFMPGQRLPRPRLAHAQHQRMAFLVLLGVQLQRAAQVVEAVRQAHRRGAGHGAVLLVGHHIDAGQRRTRAHSR